MATLVDNLIEDEAERERLLAKPTCFIIVGRPGVGKSTLAKKIAESWGCILIDDTNLLNTHIKNETKEGLELLDILSEGRSVPEDVVLKMILARLNSPDVEHYGYVLSCLPFMSEEHLKINEQIELIKNLKLTPDFIINIKCPDKDLVQRLSGLKQDPETGQFYNKDQWQRKEVYNKEKKNKEQDAEDTEDVEEQEEELSKDTIDRMVWTPEYVAKNAFVRINMYKDNMLRPLEDYMANHNPLYLLELDGNNTTEEWHLSVMSRLETLAINRIPVPVLLHQTEDEEMPEDVSTEDLLRIMSSYRIMVPGFRWRRSRWGRTCPVALKEGKVVSGNPQFSVGFQDKLYILSSAEAHHKFVTNPRPYLLPPMPRLPCKVSIIGPSLVGKTTLCKLLAQHYNAAVIDMEELLQPVLVKAKEERIHKIKEETTQAAIDKIKMKMKEDGQNSDETSSIEVTEDHPLVQAMVLSAVEQAKQSSTTYFGLYAEILEKRIKEIEEVEGKTGWVLDNFPKNLSQMDALQQAGLLPEVFFCLADSDGHQVLRRLYEMNKESVKNSVKKKLEDEQSQAIELSNQKEQESEGQSNMKTVMEETHEDPKELNTTSPANPNTVLKEAAVVVHDDSELGYTDGPEMNEYKLQLRQFVGEWEKMQSGLTVTHCTLEIGRKSPENLLQEMIHQMDKPFQYVSWELSEEDMEKDAEDIEALAQLERAEEGSDDDYSPGEGNEGDTTTNRFLGDTQHFCPVVLKDHNVLRLCTDEIAAKYREKTYYFSSLEARESFLQNPDQFVAHTEPLKPPALRIFLLGSGGSGKTTNGKWLAQQLGLFHIQFREQLQMLIMAKTKMRIPDADELVLLQDDSEDLDAKIMEARAEDEKEPEDPYDSMNETEQEELTEDEMAIKAYLSDGDPLNPKILDMTIAPYWKHEPYKSTGFILEGFPNDPNEVQYMFEQKFFPDVVVMMKVDAEDVQSRLLPQYLEIWRERRNKREAQLKLLHDLRKKKREEDISKRKAELMGEQDLKLSFQAGTKYDEEHETADIEEMIEALLEEEFPAEEDEDDIENEETEELATNRLEIGIKERFVTQETNLSSVMELLGEHNIPRMGINASHKLRIVQCQLLKKIKPLLTNRESLFQKCHPIPYSLAYKLLLSSFKFFSAFGFLDPIKLYKERDLIQPLKWPFNTTYPLLFHQYIYFFASKENCNTFMLNPLKYLRQPKPTPSLPIKIAVTGPPKSGKTTVAQIFSQKYGLARLSIGSVMRMVLDTQGNTDLAIQMKEYLLQGLVVPDELAIQCLEVALMNSVCSTQGYVLDGFPMTLKQAELMGSQNIIPMIVVELELDIVEVLKRGLADKMKPNKPHLTHDSSEILHIRNSCYKKEVVHVRHHFQQQYQNCLLLNGLKSKWWIWDRMIKEVSTSMKYIQTYLDRIQRGQAACINKLCITPKEFDCRLGEFGQYCPVCMALHYHLVDISETAALTHAAEYRGHYFKMCDENHLEMFLSTPDQFVTPGCPHTLPKPHLLPRKLTEIQVKNRFPQQVEMKGFCPVTYLDGKQRYEALVRGKMEYAVEYRERIYIFETKEKRDKFMRTPETYWAQKLPIKVPPLSDPVHLTSLPTLGYLEQGVAEAVIKAMTAAGCLKPKHPYLSLKRSALSYVALYLKAFNHKSTDSIRQLYKKKLALFEENCMLIPYLSTVMKGNYRPPSERPIDFEFKLNRFLGLRDLPGANGVQPD
ncbi:adenylate kinase 9 isoform X1 [Oreochromis aureus]|uniref:adenylate kinase 9 isoform X1 n=1 Tax=Oreochromis aureus TaxID=47969 RepID=UPI001952C33F|nr:adenylate kinase 9 isoform X1 [Oreochromis aureus]XP_039454979.1 adenylate kinase 9 isoform X1 [Oreochromis aureus]